MTDPHPIADRLQRLEEAAAFDQHRVDQLDEQVRALGRLVDLLAQRIGRMESRLSTLTEGDGPADAGPSNPSHTGRDDFTTDGTGDHGEGAAR